MKLVPKLLAPVAILSVALIAIVALAAVMNLQVAAAIDKVVDGKDEVAAASDVRSLSRSIQRDTLKLVLSRDAQEREALNAQLEKRGVEMQARVEVLMKHVADDPGALPNYRATSADLDAALKSVRAEAVEGRYEDAWRHFQEKVVPAERAMSRLTDTFIDRRTQSLAAVTREAHDMDALALRLIVGGAAAGLVVSAGIGAAIAIRGVATPTRTLAGRVGAMVEGDLSVPVEGTGRGDELGDIARALETFRGQLADAERLRREADETRASSEAERARRAAAEREAAEAQAQVVEGLAEGLSALAAGRLSFRIERVFPDAYAKLRSDFNGAMAELEGAMATIAETTRTISGGTAEISSAMGDMSRRTEQQAASIEETAAAIDEISATVTKSAEGAGVARRSADAARSDADASRQVVGEAVDAMTRIAHSAREIGQIIGVIDEIAFQTNLLALNAGVEAARAGEAGRGFAVVAQEVRALAQRSAQAAKEIKSLILTSNEQVDAGVKLVARTDESLAGIVARFEQINALVAEIAASAGEQASAITQINAAIGDIDRSTQQNAAMAEQSTAASRSLAEEGARLAGLVARFETSSPASGASPGLSPAPDGAQPVRPTGRIASLGRALKSAVQRKVAPAPEDESWEEF